MTRNQSSIAANNNRVINITVDSLNGTSIEDIKDMTLNMKIPHSLSTKTKTEAEMSK